MFQVAADLTEEGSRSKKRTKEEGDLISASHALSSATELLEASLHRSTRLINISVATFHWRSNNNVTFEHISFRELLSRSFTAMDKTTITFYKENNIPIVIFNLLEYGNISRVLCGDQEAYYDMLVKYREELTRPFQEAMDFLRSVESQLNALTTVSAHFSCETNSE